MLLDFEDDMFFDLREFEIDEREFETDIFELQRTTGKAAAERDLLPWKEKRGISQRDQRYLSIHENIEDLQLIKINNNMET